MLCQRGLYFEQCLTPDWLNSAVCPCPSLPLRNNIHFLARSGHGCKIKDFFSPGYRALMLLCG